MLGTTSSRIPYDGIDNMEVTPEEVDVLMREGTKIAPSLAYTRILRAYAGVRPLVAADNDPSGHACTTTQVDKVLAVQTVDGILYLAHRYLLALTHKRLVLLRRGRHSCEVQQLC